MWTCHAFRMSSFRSPQLPWPSPSTTPEQTVIIVGAEPRLAAQLIQTAASAAFNPTGRPLTDLRTAITRLGHRLVESAAMAFAVRQMKDSESLVCIAHPLTALWKDCIAVASISQVVARRTKVNPDEAFLTGLLHGIGRLYVMVRSVGSAARLGRDQSYVDLVNGWQAAIGRAVLENWGFAEDISEAVGNQNDYQHKSKFQADLSDVLIVSVILAEVLKNTVIRTVPMDGIDPFQSVGPQRSGLCRDPYARRLSIGLVARRVGLLRGIVVRCLGPDAVHCLTLHRIASSPAV